MCMWVANILRKLVPLITGSPPCPPKWTWLPLTMTCCPSTVIPAAAISILLPLESSTVVPEPLMVMMFPLASSITISLASASLMTEILKGRGRKSAERLFRDFHALCTGDEAGENREPEDPEAMERLQVLAGVREFPARVKCATLAWHTMDAALRGRDDEDVTTE